MKVWQDLQKGKDACFITRIKTDKTIRKYLKPKALAACFDLKSYTRHAHMVWGRVLTAG
jgi:adenylosuccinate lyase